MAAGQRAPGAVWTPEDTVLAMALIHIEDDTCSGCGLPLSESTADGHNADTGEATYTVPPPTRCHACTAIADAASDYTDPDKGVPHPHALRYGARLQPRGSTPT